MTPNSGGLRATNKIKLSALVLFGVVGMYVALAFASGPLSQQPPDASRFIVVAACLLSLCSVALIPRLGYGWLSAPTIIALYIWVLHFPLSLVAVSAPFLAQRLPWMLEWVTSESWIRATFFSCMCLLGFLAGCALSVIVRGSGKHVVKDEPDAENWLGNKCLGATGTVLLASGVMVGALGFLMAGGLGVYSFSYVDILDNVLPVLSPCLTLLGIGLPMTIAAAPTRYLKWIIILELACAVFFMSLGIRMYAVFPFIVLVVLLAKRGIRVRAGTLALIVVIGLAAFSVMREMRNAFGSGGRSVEVSAALPLEAITELGGTCQTVSLVIAWIDNGNDFALGKSYAYGFAWLFRDRSNRSSSGYAPAQFEWFLFNNFQGGGGSMVGEAFYNFGWFGGMLVFPVLAFVLCRFDARANTPRKLAVLGIVLYAVLSWTRAQFTQLPGFLLYAVVLWHMQLFWPLAKNRTRQAIRAVKDYDL